MSSNDKYFAIGLVGIVAIFGSVVLELAQAATLAPQEVVQLERVVIVGKRTASMEQLPRVVIEGRRTLPGAGVQVAAVKAAAGAL